MNTLKQCFTIILSGNKEQSRHAARQVRKLLYSATASKKDDFQEIDRLVRNAPEEYKKISEDWRRENFVIAISVIYFLHDKKTHPGCLFPWLFELLQHKNGYIRYAAVRMFIDELGPLTVHLRFPTEADKFKSKIAQEQANIILCELNVNLMALSDDLWEPKYKKYKYVDSLPASPYKSIQMVLAELEDNMRES